MPSYQIRCINKNPREDRHHSITHVGGVDGNRWKITQADAISRIERGTDSFYTSVGGHHANVMVATHSGRKYIKTVNDRDTPDNLLSLPECP